VIPDELSSRRRWWRLLFLISKSSSDFLLWLAVISIDLNLLLTGFKCGRLMWKTTANLGELRTIVVSVLVVVPVVVTTL
jgi:hypothetical protein